MLPLHYNTPILLDSHMWRHTHVTILSWALLYTSFSLVLLFAKQEKSSLRNLVVITFVLWSKVIMLIVVITLAVIITTKFDRYYFCTVIKKSCLWRNIYLALHFGEPLSQKRAKLGLIPELRFCLMRVLLATRVIDVADMMHSSVRATIVAHPPASGYYSAWKIFCTLKISLHPRKEQPMNIYCGIS